MCFLKKKEKNNEPEFKNKKIDKWKLDDTPEYDLVAIYEKCIEEMTLQQSKRDQIITIYLAMFSFIVPFAFSNEQLSLFLKGFVFLSIAIIGLAFSLIIIRYRVYKEAYWICCEAITNLMSFKKGQLDKETIQAVYYRCLYKKGRNYLKGTKFDNIGFFKKNIFSGETIYFLIHSFMASLMLGLSVFLITYKTEINSLLLTGIISILSFVWQMYCYFKNLTEIYSVLTKNTETAFNKAFSKAWFLHLYVEK